MGFSKLIDVLGLKQYLLIGVLVTLGLVYWRFSAMQSELETARTLIGQYAANEQTLIDGKRDAEARIVKLDQAELRLNSEIKQHKADLKRLTKNLEDLKGKNYANPQNRKTVECLDVMAPDADGMLQPDQ